MAPATGRVTIDGQPYAEGKVMFSPVAKGEQRIIGRPAFGKLRSDGTFDLSTYEEADGAVVGDHWATLVHIKPDNQSATSAPANLPSFKRVTYPTRLTVVSGEQNEFELAFSSEDIKRYARHDD